VSCYVLTRRIMVLTALFAGGITLPAFAATSWDGESATGWWFDPVNWNMNGAAEVPPFFAPHTNNGTSATDTNIHNGFDHEAQGVVFDPDNDPFFASLTDADFDHATEDNALFDRDTIHRLFITGTAATTDNRFTLKSGTLDVINRGVDRTGSAGHVQIGRGGATPGLKGTMVQTGGSFLVRDDNLDIGNFETSSGTGIYEYHGGTLEVGLETASSKGLRLGNGGSSSPGALSGYIGVHNNGEAGHIRAWNFVAGAFINTSGSAISNTVSTVEFFADQNGTRPIQVTNSLSINHQDDTAVSGSSRSAVLDLSLDAAPTLLGGGVPISMGLFDVGNAITGQSGVFYSDSVANGGVAYSEGDLVTATIGSSIYRWTISYTGNINWSDFDNSVVSSIDGPGTGTDIVLIGHNSDVGVGTPGDFDSDGDVDGRDFLVWQRGDSPSPLSAADLSDWQTNYGSGPLGALAAVPEPSTIISCLGLFIVSLTGGRRGLR
jgi:hypothetical protein